MYSETDAQDWFKKWEGDIEHMYLDTVGVVTVGVGAALLAVADATALAFVVRAGGAAATTAQITTDYDEVKKQTKGQLAATYKQYTKCDLPQAKRDELLLTKIRGFDARLKARLPDFASYPDPAQLGLLEMIYNLGESGLFDKFPSFIKAVKAKDWTTASSECNRIGPSKARNDATKALFTKAGSETHTAEPWLPNSIWNLWPFGKPSGWTWPM